MCGPLGSLLVPPPLARGREQSQLLWLLGTVQCRFLLVAPPWSAREAISASVADVMLSVGSIVYFLHGHMLDVRGGLTCCLEDS